MATAIAYCPATRRMVLGTFQVPTCAQVPPAFTLGISCYERPVATLALPQPERIDGLAPENLAIDPTGRAWFIRAGVVKTIEPQAPNGGLTDDLPEKATAIAGLSAIALDATGKLWVNHPAGPGAPTTHEIRRYATDGTPMGAYTVPFPAMRLLSDGVGGMWVSDRPGGQLAHLGADGTVGPALGVTASDMAVDAQHRLWVANGLSLLVLDTEGREVRQLDIPATQVAIGDGFVFARDSYVSVRKIAL
jgi:streptogramin lyase